MERRGEERANGGSLRGFEIFEPAVRGNGEQEGLRLEIGIRVV